MAAKGKNCPERLIKTARERFYGRFPSLRPKALPPIPEAGRVVLGRDNDGQPFCLDGRLLSAHVNMTGGIGGGKSSCLRHIAWQHMDKAGCALIQIDPHGCHEDSLHRTTLRRAIDTKLYERKKVVVIDANSDHCTGLKLLQSNATGPVMADHMIEAFQRMQDDENLLEKPTLRRALHGLLAVLSELGWSLAEADLLLDPDDPHGLREWALHQITDRYAKKAFLRLQYLAGDPRLRKEFEIETIGTENRLAPLLSSPAMRAIVGHQMLDMREVLDQGTVVLVNAAGSDAASEGAGDLLGKLVMRSVLFAAKRRSADTVALVVADECPRYVSQDWERALAELRKYRVGIVSAHQTFAQFGEVGDPVRDAIEKIPATKIAFRLNSMREAAELAPDLMRLNLEMPVEALTKETIVGYEVRRMRNASAGATATQTNSFQRTDTTGTGLTRSRELSEAQSSVRTQSKGTSQSQTAGWSHSVADGDTDGRATTSSRTESNSHSEGEDESMARGTTRTRGGGSSEQSGAASGAHFAQSFNVPVNGWQSGEGAYAAAAGFGAADGRTVTAGYDASRNQTVGSSDNWSDGESESSAHSSQRSHTSGVADSDAESQSHAHSHIETNTESQSATAGTSEGVAVADGTNRGRSEGTAETQQASVSTATGTSMALGRTSAEGWGEALAPILAMRPTAVHGLQNVTHMAAEMLCSLPTGVAVVRTIKDGRIEGAVVRIPFRDCPAVSDQQYAADLQTLAPHSIGMPMVDAMRTIDERENKIIAHASTMKIVGSSRPAHSGLPEPTEAREFRVLRPDSIDRRKGVGVNFFGEATRRGRPRKEPAGQADREAVSTLSDPPPEGL